MDAFPPLNQTESNSLISSTDVRFNRLLVYVLAVLGGVLLSLWRIHFNDLINQDAVYYLQAAAGDLESARHLNNWLFYSWCIRFVSDGLGLELLGAAYLINTFLGAILVYSFLRVVEMFNGDGRTLFWAALVILSLPYLNDNRAEIIRGHGYWAFSMLGLIYYIRLFREFSWWSLAGWTGSMVLATLFRIEGLVIVCLAPMGLLLNTRIAWKARFYSLLKTSIPLLLGAAFLLLLYLQMDSFQNRLLEVFTSLVSMGNALLIKVPHKADLLRQHVFPLFSRDGSLLSVYLVLLFMIIKDFIESMSLPYFMIWLFRRSLPATGLASDAASIIGFFTAANFVVLVPYMLQHFVMVSRYTVMASLLLLIVVAFSLAELHRKQSADGVKKHRLWFNAVLLVMVLMFVLGVKTSESKKLYVLDAANWMQQNLPDKTHVGTDYQKERLEYYANSSGEGRTMDAYIEVSDISSKIIKMPEYEYFMLRVKAGELVTDLPSARWVHKHSEKIHELLDSKGNGYFIYSSTYAMPAK
jgi:hypothetical protein